MRILVAEDSLVQRQILVEVLAGWGYEVVPTADGCEAWEVLQRENAPQLAILDWIMPEMDGVEVCQEVRKRGREPYVYLILLTSRDEKEETVQGLDAGADDYLTKPFVPDELRARLRAGERILDLQHELIAAREELRHDAIHDPLTGVLNRREMHTMLERELNRSRRTELPVGVVMCDIDHFKNINDIFGHPAGDAVLQEVARRIVGTVRPYDSVARYGGEEFIIILPACDAHRARCVAERVRMNVRHSSVDTTGASIPVTLSLGVATSAECISSACARESAEEIVRAADTALYGAKRNGRNRVEILQRQMVAKGRQIGGTIVSLSHESLPLPHPDGDWREEDTPEQVRGILPEGL